MRRALMLTQLGVAALAVLTLVVALAIVIAARDTQAAVMRAVDDAVLLAAQAEPDLRTGDLAHLGRQLRSHEEQTGVAAAIVSTDGTPVIASTPGLVQLDEADQRRVNAALSGVASAQDGPIWPWRREPVVVAEPIHRAGVVIGAVLAVSPSDGLRKSITTMWSLLAGSCVLALLAMGALTESLARRVSRPVLQLTEAARSFGQGRLRERVDPPSGPAELRQLAESFNEMAGRLNTLLERQRSFASHASHQLRAPLAALRIRADGLGYALADEAQPDLALMVEEIDRLAGICDALLAFARVRSPTAEEDIDIGAVLDGRFAAWLPAAQARGVRLVRDGAASALARVSPEILEQVVDVLVDNAIKYAGTGATVTLGVGAQDDQVDVHVIDDGPGMSAAELARAATPFWGMARRASDKGSGLGLTIASALAEAAGGRLHLFRFEPHGVHARIRLAGAFPDRVGARPD